MKRLKIYFTILLSALTMFSCVKDLNVTPIDPDSIMAGNLGDNPEYMKEVLAKIYASFTISGQGNDAGADIVASDDNFFTFTRALWNLQEITTDEAICGWGDIGIADLNTQTWSPTNPFLTALYQRLGLSITYANDFIKNAQDNSSADVQRYVAEARFLRALAYFYYMDLFGNPPFTTEKDGVGKFNPQQIKRADLFNYIVSELRDIENDLGEPGFSYPEADKAAAWMLLARTYLNAEVYTGTAKWDSVIYYCDKVEEAGYELANDYRQNFTADNDGDNNPEMIFAFAYDGVYTQGYTGTTFIIESSSDATYIRAEDYHGLTTNTNWNGNRARKDFMNIMVDTLATYGGAIPSDDPEFSQCPDNRVYLKQKKSIDIPSPSSSGDYGIGVYKFTAKNLDGSLPTNYNSAYACTDFPIFRFADALLMRAEANHRLGNDPAAVDDINRIRRRAYGDTSGDVSTAQINDRFILDERAREFYYEGQRRTDLVRFGQFTDGDYLWSWKGNVAAGAQTSSHLNLFPIPGDEVSANPNIKQNTGY
ncbi:RagB/SusD family nutrient uptake outer membrane protein [Saccharicrinis sp. FJH54]|uniref:RagB/SusD family nutrient uptake outer membrane protein n=1 Tax=Saccharicrinis sp. FJH54 TaxID=3344665 RepID=UPI0035D4ED49